MKRGKCIADRDSVIQSPLPGLFEKTRFHPVPDSLWPARHTSEEDFLRILTSPEPYKGIDFEFGTKELGPRNVYNVTIVGIAQGNEGAVRYATPELLRKTAERIRDFPGTKWVAHSAAGADRDVIDTVTGITTPFEHWADSMTSHFVTHQHLTKNPAKSESDDSGALGFMDLHHSAMMATKLPGWKFCTGKSCFAQYDSTYPCPTHRPTMYCLVDAVAGLHAHLAHRAHPLWNQDFYEARFKITDLCLKMQRKGVFVDRKYVNDLNTWLQEKKGLLFSDGSFFNPNSPDQVTTWFNERGIHLKGSTKKDVEKELELQLGAAGLTKEDLFSGEGEIPEVLDALYRLDQWKKSGKGTDPWYAPGLFHKDGLLHPRFVGTGASSGRLSCVRPNFMNVAARDWGALVRGAVIPRDPSHDWIKADYGQLELRMCLWLAGIEPPPTDCFLWMIDAAPDLILNAASRSNPRAYAEDPETAARDMLKVASHSSDYLSGIKVIPLRELCLFTREIEAGVLRPYLKKYVIGGKDYGIPWLQKDWLFMGGVVAFTGSNLADTLYGILPRTAPWQQKWARRKAALEIQEDVYFAKFRAIREWHMKILEEAESGIVRTPTGAFMELWGTPEERAKVVAMSYGQGDSARFVQEKMQVYADAGEIPTLQVHDELNTEKPEGWTDQQVKDYFLDVMATESKLLPGFKCPIGIYRGKSWVEWKGKGERGKAKFGEEWRDVPKQLVKIHGVPKR